MSHKILLILSQPTQSTESLEILSKSEALELEVVYLSGTDNSMWQGEEYINKQTLQLKIPQFLKTRVLKNFSPLPSLNSFFGLIHPGLCRLISGYDCIVVYGHGYFSMCLAVLIAKIKGIPVLLSNDAVELTPQREFKKRIKKILYPFLYNKFTNGVLVPSTAARNFQICLGVKKENIFLTPYVVDNNKIVKMAENLDKEKERESLNIPLNKKVVLFVGKLISRKNPFDLLEAFRKAEINDAVLVYVGSGPLLQSLRDKIESYGMNECVLCLGELNYEKLIGAYIASDILVHPAEFEPWGLIVNEAMICGRTVITSSKVGASYDLINNSENGFTYPVGDVTELSRIISKILSDLNLSRDIGLKAKESMKNWSPQNNAAEHLIAFNKILANQLQ